MSLLRRHLVCFYCGRRSAKGHPSGTRQWECGNCEAINHLDEVRNAYDFVYYLPPLSFLTKADKPLQNGEITDPPATASQTNARFAHSAPRPVSRELGSSDTSLFCARCLNNQHILTQTLASYLPETTDPDYHAYEKSYTKYRKQLEERYPQVCRKCEPRVRERLRVTGYAAKTDHLRRMIEQTRNGQGRRLRGWGWQDNVVVLAGLCWWASLMMQLVWHTLSATLGAQWADDLYGLHPITALPECVRRAFAREPVEPACTSLLDAFTTLCGIFAGYCLILGWLSIWWNPQLQRKLRGNVGRMVGLTEYYKLQAIFLLVRCAVWWFLANRPSPSIDPRTAKAAHAFMVVFTTVVCFTLSLSHSKLTPSQLIIVSYRTVYWDPTPLISLRSNYESLLSPQQLEQSATSISSQEPPGPISTTTNINAQVHRNFGDPTFQPPQQQRFDINLLAPNPPRPYQTNRYNPPTPPPESDDADTMDWTPSHTLPSATPYHPPQPATRPPNPFYGNLPPRPISQAHALRNPILQAPGPLERASAQQQNFFRRQPNSIQTPKQVVRGRSGLSDMQLDDGTFSPTTDGGVSEDLSPRKVDFRQPKFFPRKDHENDTGLENLFSSVFSLKDQPAAVHEDEETNEGFGASASRERNNRSNQQQTSRRVLQPEQPQGRRQARSLFRAEVVLPVILLALIAQVWWFDVTKFARLLGGGEPGAEVEI